MIKIGNNNKFNKSIIGSNNNIKTNIGCNKKVREDKDKQFILKNILIPIAVGLIIAYIVYLLKWN